jgi:hypothetical protein
VYLPVASLKPPHIRENDMLKSAFDSTDTITKILLEDCGGHGRAIEILWTLTKVDGSWKHNIGNFMRDFRRCFLTLSFTDEEVQAIVQVALCHQQLYSQKEVLTTGRHPDELAGPGLIRYG